MCVPDAVKNLNVKVFNLTSITNKTRNEVWPEMCKWKCRLDAIVCKNKQHRKDGKCRCEFKGLNDKGVCNKRSIWNPSNNECEYDKSCDFGEYLDYENRKCSKKSVDRLVEECTESVDEDKIAEMNLFQHGNKHACFYIRIGIQES